MGVYYKFRPSVSPSVGSTSIVLTIESNSTHNRTLGVLLVFIKNSDKITVEYGFMNLNNKAVNIPTKLNSYYVVGLTVISSRAADKMNLKLS